MLTTFFLYFGPDFVALFVYSWLLMQFCLAWTAVEHDVLLFVINCFMVTCLWCS